MKRVSILFAMALAFIGFAACNNDHDGDDGATDDSTEMNTTTNTTTTTTSTSYVDLSTGNAVTKNETTGRYEDNTGTPVEFYVDLSSNDTFYGATGQNVNNALMKDEEGRWKMDETKIKVDGNDVKMKQGDEKTKVEDGDVKTK